MGGFVVIATMAAPVPTLANVAWPALHLEFNLLAWWVIVVGLCVEFFFVRKLFGLSFKRAAVATVTANAASTVVGLASIPFGGLAWDFFPGVLFSSLFNMGMFSPISWTMTLIWACVANVLVEGLVYRRGFKLPFRFKGRYFWWLMLANAISVSLGAVNMVIKQGPSL